MNINPALIAAFLAAAPRDFDLDFKNGVYSRNGVLIPSLAGVAGFSHTQSGSCFEIAPDGSLVAFAANEPRVVPGLGLWCRSAFTNKALQSQQLNTTSWIGSAPVTADAAVAPDGSTTADVITDNSATYLTREQNVAYGATMCGSLFVEKDAVPKSVRSGLLRVQFVGVTTQYVDLRFDTSTGEKSAHAAGGPTLLSSGIDDVGDYWRVWIAAQDTGGNTYGKLNIYPAPGVNLSTAYDPTVTGSITAWQAQIVNGRQPGPIIPTTSATASNGASVTTIPYAQADEDFILLAKINMAEGSTSATRTIASLVGATTADRFALTLSSANAVAADVQASSSPQSPGAFTSGGVTTGTAVVELCYRGGKLALGEKIGAGAVNLGAEGSAITFPGGLAELQIGHLGGAAQLNGLNARTHIIPGTFDDTQRANLITEMAA